MADQPTQGSELDPVCGMTVQPATAAASHQHEGKTYYFCSQGCLEKFRAGPRSIFDGDDRTPGVDGRATRRKAVPHGGGTLCRAKKISVSSIQSAA